MRTLSQHIEYLLTRHDCVILPGFGAFIAERHAATVDDVKGSMLPPTRNISFNSVVVSDDGLLAHSISRKSKISFEEARRIVDNKISALKETLSSRSDVTIGKIGSLHQESESRISFTPNCNASTKAVRSGMTPFMLPPLLSSKDSILSENPKPTVTEKGAYSDERYYLLKIPKTLVRVAASVIIIFCSALSLIVPSSNTGRNSYKASVVEVESIFNVIDSHKASINAEKVKKTPVVMQDEPASSEADIQVKKYHLIVGTFTTEKQAMNFIEFHAAENLTLASNNKIWRVAAASSDSHAELQEMLNKTAFRTQFPGAWIWESNK